MSLCGNFNWPPRLVTVPGLHGSEEAHWQTWLERQFAHSLRVEQADWEAPSLDAWARSVGELLERERGPFVLAAHSYGCLATIRALECYVPTAEVAGVLLVAPASPEKFAAVGRLSPHRLAVSSILIGSENDPWMPAPEALQLASRLGSAFVNLGAVGHINTEAGFGPWPRAKFFIDTLVHHAAKKVFHPIEQQSVEALEPSL
jgi:predicted alpha/beta hydrolase family esterase